MKQQKLTERRGWINLDTSQPFEELVCRSGCSHLSTATGSPYDHEALWRSRFGHWILHAWSQVQEPSETWTKLAPSDAAHWLIHNGHEHDDLSRFMEEPIVSMQGGR